MTTSLAQDAIALLIDLAQRGEIDPWDIQVVEVFDRVLSELTLTQQQNLSRSGQAFLYASMLVLLKADSLVAAANPEVEADELDLHLLDEEFNYQLPLQLEHHLQRRAVAKPPQQRRVTLTELISQLEFMATLVESKTRSPRPRKGRRPAASRSMKAIAQLAHQENLSEVAQELEQLLADLWPQLSPQQEWLDFDHLLEFKQDRVGIFWALLFLCAQSKVELSQAEFYQDLQLRPFNLEAAQEFPA